MKLSTIVRCVLVLAGAGSACTGEVAGFFANVPVSFEIDGQRWPPGRYRFDVASWESCHVRLTPTFVDRPQAVRLSKDTARCSISEGYVDPIEISVDANHAEGVLVRFRVPASRKGEVREVAIGARRVE
jgi:hypothetical protein